MVIANRSLLDQQLDIPQLAEGMMVKLPRVIQRPSKNG